MTQQLSTPTPTRLSTANGAARKAYMVGGGIGSLAAAAFLIRDGNVPGRNITIYEAMPRRKRLLLLSAFIIPVWLGATLGYWGLRGRSDLPKLIVLAFTTGTLMTAVVEEIIPEAHQTQDTNWSTLTFIGSFALSILFSAYLE